MARKVTLKEIAKEVGLSVTTVSLVLNDRECRVSEENRRRIKTIAREKHYVPNQIARSLVTQHSMTLGLIVPDLETHLYGAMAKKLERICREAGYALFITSSHDHTVDDMRLLHMFWNRGVDGVFYVPSTKSATSNELMDMLSNYAIPGVVIGRSAVHVPWDSVSFDNRAGGRVATRALLDAGHTKIGCLINATHTVSGHQRAEGYVEAFHEAGLKFDQSLIVECDRSIEGGRTGCEKLLEAGVTGIVAADDILTYGTMHTLYAHGLKVPDDISVVGYDLAGMRDMFSPAITTVDANIDEMISQAFDLLSTRLGKDAEEPSEKKLHHMIAPCLTHKASIGNL